MECVAIDDEPMALEIISTFCKRQGQIQVKTFTNPLKGWECVMLEKPDILFLDVEMGDVSGVELAVNLPKNTSLILTTAYARYAIDGFDLNAVDFLHKPFSYSRFEKAIQKVAELRSLQKISSHPVFTCESITLKVEYRNTNIKLNDIIYIESMDNYARFHLQGKSPLMSQVSLKKLQQLLPPEEFVRIHKSFIVPLYRVTSYNNKEVILNDGTALSIGRNYIKHFAEKYVQQPSPY